MKFRISTDKTKLVLIDSTKQEIHQLKIWLNKYVEGYRFKQRFKLGVWDGKIDHFKDGRINIGLWSEIFQCCKTHDFKFEIENKDEFPIDKKITIEEISGFCYDFFKDHKTKDGLKQFMPYEHQIYAVYKMFRHKFGLIEVATSGGKSLILSTFIFYMLKNMNPNAKFLLIVPSISLVTQFYNDLNEYNIGYNNENKNPLDLRINEVMSDLPRKFFGVGEPNIYIGTYQSFNNFDPLFFKQFDVVFNDESHLAKNAVLQKIMNYASVSEYRLGVSGTFFNENTAELQSLESAVGPILYKMGADILMKKGIISPLKIKAIILNHEDQEFSNSIFTLKKSGNGKRAYELEKEYCQSSLKRKMFLLKLVKKFDKNSLILFNNVKFGTELYNFFRDNIGDKEFYYIDGEISKEKREAIKKNMEITTGKVKICIASYGTMSLGISINALFNMVLADSSKSFIRIIQSIGRIIRLHPEKDKAIIFDIVDRFSTKTENILFSHFKKRKEYYDKVRYPYDELRITL